MMANSPVEHGLDSPCSPVRAQPATEPSDTHLLLSFVTQKNREAFEALVQRHGPMVLSVCRRVLRDRHDAEDAFQATFLVLVRKAASIRRPELLANWLYGVAYRISLRSKANASRRRLLERQTVTMPTTEPVTDVGRQELRSVVLPMEVAAWGFA